MALKDMLPDGVTPWHAAALVGGAVAAAFGASHAWPAVRRALRLDVPVGALSPLHQRLLEACMSAQPHVSALTRRTPLLESEALVRASGAARVWLKLESDQVTGSFKARGAASAVGQQRKAAALHGVATASTGNHARGVLRAFSSLIGKASGASVQVFVPSSIAAAKLAKLKALGASVRVSSSDDCEKAEAEARAWAEGSGAVFVSPYNDLLVVGGQGTAGLELVEQAPAPPDIVLVPVGGGGLISGIAAAVKARIPGAQVVGCQPEVNCCMKASLEAGRILGEGEFANGATLSDGTAGGIEKGSLTFEACGELVDAWLTATEAEILDGMALVLAEHGRVVEGAAASAVACLTAERNRARFAGKRVAVVICGGNVAPATVRRVAERAEELASVAEARLAAVA